MAGVTIEMLRTLLPTHGIMRYDNSSQRITLRDGREYCVWSYRQTTSAQTSLAALERLNDDDAVPAIRAADVTGRLGGGCMLVVDAPRGQALAHVAARLTSDQLYAIGTQLGQIVARWHLVRFSGHGALNDCTHPVEALVAQRVTQAITTLVDARIVTPAIGHDLTTVIQAYAHIPSPHAVLVCGDIAPETVWVERQQQRWQITAITSWSSAHAGIAAAEHVRIQHHFDGEQWFSLRVGYGERYDEQTTDIGMQLREHALRGERIIFTLQLAASAARRGHHDRAHTLLTLVQRWCATYSSESSFSTTEENA